jgi:lipopolysaccharide export system permease protein
MRAMANRRINSYVFYEILTPTLLSLVVFTFILLMARLPGLTELVINKGVPLVDIMKLFFFLLPNFLIITIPLSFLLGILLAFGRLSAESEFTALKSAGVSLYSLLRPVLYFSLVCTLINASLILYGKPVGNTALHQLLFSIASNQVSVGIESGVFNDNFDNLVIYTETFDDSQGKMNKVFLSDERTANDPVNIFAKEGVFIRDPQLATLTLRLKQGAIHHRPPDGAKDSYQTIGFSTYDINLDINKNLAEAPTRSRSDNEFRTQKLIAAINSATQPREKNRLKAELHKRFSTTLTPMVFSLVGIPLALQSNRSGKGAGFALALGIALSYFLLLSFARTVAENGTIPAYLALYLPNLLFLAGGVIALQRTANERPVIFSNASIRRLFLLLGGKSV